MKNITVILPIHKWDDEHMYMFNNAFQSVEQFYNDVKLLIVGPNNVLSNININETYITISKINPYNSLTGKLLTTWFVITLNIPAERLRK